MRKILFGLSGSIACFKACAAISKLVQRGFEVQTVATRSALQFIGPATLEGLTGKPVLSETFEHSRHMDHIYLNRWADLIILCPASANTLNKMASGIGDDIWTTMFLAHDFTKPYLVAPAMNSQMLAHPATQGSLQKLQRWGVKILGTNAGALACGEEGLGKLLEPDSIISAVEDALRADNSLRVLITSGGTREPIDGVRTITNSSTGQTGAELADYFTSRGHDVTLVKAQSAVTPHLETRIETFVSFADLDAQLEKKLKSNAYDLVIHAAAVSDYSVDWIERNGEKYLPSPDQKLSSQSNEMTVHLKRNHKIIERIKTYSPHVKLVGFKLTQTPDLEARTKAALKVAGSADLVVQNDVSEISPTQHRSVLLTKDSVLGECQTKEELARALESFALNKPMATKELL